MLIKFIPTEDFDEAYNLLSSVFDDSEIRPYEAVKKRYDEHIYQLIGIYDDSLVGALVLTKFDNIVFLENLGIKSDCQSHGYGSILLNHISNLYPNALIVLEVEVDNKIKQRIKFYERNGFQFDNHTYMLPTIGNKRCENPMHLMLKGADWSESLYTKIKKAIFENAYKSNY